MTQQTIRKDKANGLVQDKLEELEQYFEDVVFGYQSRKTEVNHLVMEKVERGVKEANEKEEHKAVKAVAKLEEEISKKVRLSGEDIGQTKTLLAEFISKEWLYFNQILQCQGQDEEELLELINSTTQKRMSELRGHVAKEKYESAQGPTITKLRNLLRQKCDFLQKQLTILRQNTSKCKKEVTKQVKTMLRVLQQLQQHRQDRQSKQECVLGLIDQMIA